MRLDLFLVRSAGLRRSAAQRALRQGLVTVGGRPESRASLAVRAGELVALTEAAVPPPAAVADPTVLYADEALVVIDKPAGLAVHPAPGLTGPTLADWVRRTEGPWSLAAGADRPGLVHRLDRGTSGLLVLARTEAAHLALQEQLRTRTMGREYWALVEGEFREAEGRVEAAIGRDRNHPQRMAVTSRGRAAATDFWVLERLPRHCALRLRLTSGRTHQIRVHLAFIHRPVVGDWLYRNPPRPGGRPALHAAMLHLRHPSSGVELTYVSPLPEDLRELRRELGGAGEPVWPWGELGAA